MKPEPNTAAVSREMIDAEELAKRWGLPPSWVREQTRSRADNTCLASDLENTFVSHG